MPTDAPPEPHVTRWWWIRHAPVRVNNGRIYGQMDLPCETDDADAYRLLAEMLPADSVLLTSTLQRTTQTADAIRAAGLALPDAIREPAFVEQSFGDWQGLARGDFTTEMRTREASYWLAPAYERAPNGESFTDLMARAVPAINRYCGAHAGRDIVAVTHGGTIRAALCYALSLDPESALQFSIANLSVTRLDCIQSGDSRQWRVGFVNLDPTRL
ncbi:MAG: histidine phosphatase family protein [Alphaproteobacteria bacterium]|nr:histidine phosphatase family protein [Alphaproteobacteria bacterium]